MYPKMKEEKSEQTKSSFEKPTLNIRNICDREWVPKHCPFLRAMVQMTHSNRILEIGAGYTTPFLLEGLINNERVLDDGNLNKKYGRSASMIQNLW